MQSENEVKQAMDVLRKEMKEDPGYAWAWHCNIAMSCADSMVDNNNNMHTTPHKIANEAARRFMWLCFEVDSKEPTNGGSDDFEQAD